MNPWAWCSLLPALCLLGCSGPSADCAADADCPAGRYCLTGECIFDCTFDSDCPDGFRCTARGHCDRGCVVSHGGVEVCDGLDDDCDGQIDEDAIARDCPLQAGVCEGVRETCLGAAGWSGCDYGPQYSAGVDDGCEQFDNDCDGQIDEDAAPVLAPESGEQAADGLDNNCNGLVDESGGVMVPLIQFAGVWVDSYEATVFERADCAGIRYGADADDYPAEWPAQGDATVQLYACSLPGLVPSAYLSLDRARRACQAQGKRLCTDLEWDMACTSVGSRYPYGFIFGPGTCNDPVAGAQHAVETGSYPDCKDPSGVYDASGNLAEWTESQDPERPGLWQAGGASFACQVCQDDGSCTACRDGNQTDRDRMIEAASCATQNAYWDAYLPSATVPFIGVRCCYQPD